MKRNSFDHHYLQLTKKKKLFAIKLSHLFPNIQKLYFSTFFASIKIQNNQKNKKSNFKKDPNERYTVYC